MSNYPSIPEPTPDVEALYQAVLQMKQALEILMRERQPTSASAVTWEDLVALALVTPDQVP